MRKKTVEFPKLILSKDFSAFLQRLKAYSETTRAFYRLIGKPSSCLHEEAIYTQVFPRSKAPQKEETYEWHCMTFQSGVRLALQQYIHHPDPSQTERLVELILLCYQKHSYGFAATTPSFRKQLYLFFKKVPTLAPFQRKALRCERSRDLRRAYLQSLDPVRAEDRPCLHFFLQDSQFDIRWKAYRTLETIGEHPPRWSLAFRNDPMTLLASFEADEETKASWKESTDALIETLHERASPNNKTLLGCLLALPWELGIEAFALLGFDLRWLLESEERTFFPLAHPKGIDVLFDLLKVWQREMYLFPFDKLFTAWRKQSPPEVFSAFKRKLLYALFNTKHTNHPRSLQRFLEEAVRHFIPTEDRPSLYGNPPPEYERIEGELPWFADFQDPQPPEADIEAEAEADIETAVHRLPSFPQLLSPEEVVQVASAIDQMIDLYAAHEEDSYLPRLSLSPTEDGGEAEGLFEAVFESLLFLFCAYADHPQDEGLGRALLGLDWSYHFAWEDGDEEIIHEALQLLLARFPTISLIHLETLCEMKPAALRKIAIRALRPEIPEHRAWLERLRKDAYASVRAEATQQLSQVQEIPRWSLAFSSDPLQGLDPDQDRHLVSVIEHILWHLEGCPRTHPPQERLKDTLAELINQLPETMALEVIERNAIALRGASKYVGCIKRWLTSSLEGLRLFVRLVVRWSKDTYDSEYGPFYEGAEKSPRHIFQEMLSAWEAWNHLHPYHPNETKALQTQRAVFTSLLARMWPSDLAPTGLWEPFEQMSEELTRPMCLVDAISLVFKRLPASLLPIDRLYKKLQDYSPNVWTQNGQHFLQVLEDKLSPALLEEWSQTLLGASQVQVSRWAFEKQTQSVRDDREQANRWVQFAMSQPPLRRLLFDDIRLIKSLLEPLQQALLDQELSLREAAVVWRQSTEEDALLPRLSVYLVEEQFPLPPFVTRRPEHPAPKTPETYPQLPSPLAEAWRKVRKQHPPVDLKEWESVLVVLPRYDWHPEDEALVWQALEEFEKKTETRRGRASEGLLLALLYVPRLEEFPKDRLLAILSSIFAWSTMDRYDEDFHRFLAPYLAERIGDTEERILALLPQTWSEDEDDEI